MEKILTIVIPTYNMQDYLRRCLDSLIVPEEQMKQLEVLVINDGSKDNSSAIAHEYQDKYPDTFRVIDKGNGNYGSCVNRGLKEATGKYFRILDADDWFETKALAYIMLKLLELNENVDLILTNYLIAQEGKSARTVVDIPQKYNEKCIDQKKFSFKKHNLEQLLVMHSITVRTKKLIDSNYSQQTGISYTDTEFNYFSLLNSNFIYILDICLYNYYVGRAGQTMDCDVLKNKVNDFYLISNRLLENFLLQTNLQAVEIENLLIILVNVLGYFFKITLVYNSLTNILKSKINRIIELCDKIVVDDSSFLTRFRLSKLPIVRIYEVTNMDFHKVYRAIDRIRHFMV